MNTAGAAPPTPADLRASIARHRIVLYRLAAVVGVSRNRLSRMLNEHKVMPPALAVKIERTIAEAVGPGERDG